MLISFKIWQIKKEFFKVLAELSDTKYFKINLKTKCSFP